MNKNRILYIMVGVIVALSGLGALTVTVATRPAAPMPQALAALQSDNSVLVTTSPWLVFSPMGRVPSSGFVVYPGGLVDPRAYAPMARGIAANGHLVIIVPMPLNLAFFDSNRAEEVIRTFPAVKEWTIGGHSLGGVAAAMFVKSHPGTVGGLVFWASYPSDNLSESRVRVLSLYGTKDGLSTPAKIDASRALLPPAAEYVAIEGGNHGQFGWYGLQSGDGIATISREEQQEQIVNETVRFIENQ